MRSQTKTAALRLKALSLFTGAGGLDLGFAAAGIDPVACIELDPVARQTLARNRMHWNLLEEGDVHALRPRELLRCVGVAPGELDVVFGGPPCQPFSKSAFWLHEETGRLRDSRASTV